MKHLLTPLLAGTALVAGASVPSHYDGGKVPPVHRLEARDLVGDSIAPSDPNALPFSTRNTCSLCHDYDTIAGGWHFNAGETNVCPGRIGEPWFLADAATGVQLPLSLRDWPGVFKPADVGMDDFAFTRAFGRNLPGGGVACPDEEGMLSGRWNVSGGVEVNCFACHDKSGLYDHSEYVKQMSRENFAFAMSAAMAFGSVDGMASRMPEYWGLLNGPNKDDSIFRVPPRIAYDPAKFDTKNRMVFPVGEPRNDNCLNCHGVAQAGLSRMEADQDVHLRAGMSCIDCHKNDVAHNINRGIEGKGKCGMENSLSCAGCHVVKGGKAGRFGAPAPNHVGFPTVHFEKLSCTVCHSGVTKGGELGTVTTCRANRMGVYGRAKWLTAFPSIQEPVFVRNEKTGKIEPRRMVWPAYWGVRDGDGVKPLAVEKVAGIAGKTLSALKDVGAVLSLLDTDPNISAKGFRPVLAVDGKLYRANVDGIPVAFGEQAGLNGYVYVRDAGRPVPAPKQEKKELSLSDRLVKDAFDKAYPVVDKPYASIVPDAYDPAFDSSAEAEKKVAGFAKDIETIAGQLIQDEKESFDKLNADEQKARRGEILDSVKAEFVSLLTGRFADEQEAKKTTINNLISTLEVSPLYDAAKHGAVVVSGKVFYTPTGEKELTNAALPDASATPDFGFYDDKANVFTSVIDAQAFKTVAQLAGTGASLTEEMVAETLRKLADAKIEKPVYVGHGKVWELADGKLAAKEEKVAEPISWPFGHDVRPARLARGAKPVKCADCHTADSTFFFGKVASTGPLLTAQNTVFRQCDLMKVSGNYNRLFGAMFLVRPFFKIFLWVVFAVFALVAVAFTAAAIPAFLGKGGIPYGTKCENLAVLVNRLSGLAMCLAGTYLGLSGGIGWFCGGMTGYWLVLHQCAGGLFCAALLALIWFRGKNRLATKRSFWWMLAMTLAVLVVFTAVAPMMTIFGSGWQKTLLQAHRCSTFCFLAVSAWMLISGGRKE